MKPIAKRITRGGGGGWKLTFDYGIHNGHRCKSASFFFRREDALAFMVSHDYLY